jgi:hypothetical protein
MLPKDFSRAAVGKLGVPTHALRHFGQHPPVRPSFAGRRAKGALAGDASLRIGDRAVLLSPTSGRQHDIGQTRRIGRPAIAHDDKGACSQRCAYTRCPRHAGGRIRAENPQRLDLAIQRCIEQIDSLETWSGGHSRGLPESSHAIDIRRIGKAHVRGELVGEPADLAAAHRIRLARERERPHTAPPQAAGCKMAIDDRVHLVGPRGGLVHTL